MTDEVVRCRCLCHCGGVPVLHVAPDVRSPVDAITACSKCLNAHTIALVSDWPIIPKPNPLLLEWRDTYPHPDSGEGAE